MISQRAKQAFARFATPGLLFLILVGWIGNTIVSYDLIKNQRNCQGNAVRIFDQAIKARSAAGAQATLGLQHLIITVFTQKGTKAQIRSADIQAYNSWHSAVTKQNRIKLPPLPRTACG